MLRAITRLFARSSFKDADKHARQLEASELAYTLVRPPRLTDGPTTGSIHHGLGLQLGPTSSISRADLAAFMLSAAVEGLYIREPPMVATSR